MVKVLDNIARGETITDFSSTGIKDNSTRLSLVVEDDKITVKTASIDIIDKDLLVRGDVKIHGTLDVELVRSFEVITNQRYEKQYLEFSSPAGDTIGTGLLWKGQSTRQLIFKNSPDRFWLTEHVDIPADRSYLIEGTPVLSKDSLGNEVVNSNLRKLGPLKSLTVDGEVNIGDHIYYNPTSQRVGIGIEDANGLLSIYDHINNVELIVEGDDNGYGKIGTYNAKGLELVTDNQIRISITEFGNVTIGHEYKDSTITRIYGKVGIGVKNPKEQLEVAGNIRMGNRLFANGDNIPTEGTYQKGDIIWNSNPKEDTNVGWVCIGGGSPGRWKPFG